MTSDELKAALQAPFPESDIEWRIAQQGLKDGKPWGKCLAYITARAIQDRLDDVFGVMNWNVKFDVDAVNKSVLCTIAASINGIWITKQDGSEQTEFEAYKGGLSGAMKRAAVQWGIGRYLYKLESGWATFIDKRQNDSYTTQIDKVTYHWLPPKLPDWALPKRVTSSTSSQPVSSGITWAEVKAAGKENLWDETNLRRLANALFPDKSWTNYSEAEKARIMNVVTNETIASHFGGHK